MALENDWDDCYDNEFYSSENEDIFLFAHF